MKVVILAGGLGTRFGERTRLVPKPMIEIGGKPILWHIMKTYAHYGFKDFIICLGYRGEVVKRYFYEYKVLNSDLTIELGSTVQAELHTSHEEIGWRITLVDTGNSSLKGARIKRIEQFIDDDLFMLTYGDGVADIHIPSLIDYHMRMGKIGTVTAVRPPSRFGEIMIKDGLVASFSEKPQTSVGLINGGFCVFNHRLFNYLSEDKNCDFERGPLEQLAREGQLCAYEHPGQWECMDTVRDHDHLNKLWNNEEAFWKLWDDSKSSIKGSYIEVQPSQSRKGKGVLVP